MATKKSASRSSKKSSKKSTKKAARKRGSAKLASAAGGRGFDPVALKNLIVRFQRARLRPEILIDGVPVPDIIRGRFTARSATSMDEGLKLLKNIRDARFRPIRLFPIGIPFPEEYRVEFDARFRR